MAFVDQIQLQSDHNLQPFSIPPGGIWRMPNARNAFFTGRQPILNSLRRRFAQGKIGIQAIVGLGGVGKSQLATEYAWQFRDEYKVVWWLPADDATTLALSYAQLGRQLGIQLDESGNLDGVRHHLRRVLNQMSDWLLIFDNGSSVQSIENYLPQDRTGHVLITSRDMEWRGIAEPCPLRSLERSESIEFLVRRAGRRQDDVAVRRVAQALGDYPLALEQAGAHVVETGIDYATYLKRFESHWAELLARGAMRAVRGAEYPDSLAMSLELTYRQLEDDEPGAQSLLNLLSYFSGESIPISLLDAINSLYDMLPERLSAVITEPAYRDQALRVLSRFSLVEAEADTLHIHRLVATLCRSRLSTVEQSELAMIAVQCAIHAFPFDSQDPQTWPASQKVLPHALAAADHVIELGIAQESAAKLLNAAGQLMMKQGRFSEARDVLEKALNLAKAIHGPLHPRLAAMSNDLGRAMQKLGDLIGARALYESSMRIDQTIYGENESHAASVLNNYAITLHGDGDLQSAREHFERTLEVSEQQYGKEHRRVATIRNNLACVLRDCGELSDARMHFDLALHAAQVSGGEAHPLVARIAFNLGSMLRMTNELLEANRLLNLALVIDRQNYGEGHPQVVQDRSELAVIRGRMGELATAARDENESGSLSEKANPSSV